MVQSYKEDALCCKAGSCDAKWRIFCREFYTQITLAVDCAAKEARVLQRLSVLKGSIVFGKSYCVLQREPIGSKKVQNYFNVICAVKKAHHVQRAPTCCKWANYDLCAEKGLPLLIICAAKKGLVFQRAICDIGVVCWQDDPVCCKEELCDAKWRSSCEKAQT